MKHTVQPGVPLLMDAVWNGKTPPATFPGLRRPLALARRNHVEGELARAYPHELPHVLAEVGITGKLLERNLGQVADRLRQAGIPAVLIKAEPPGRCVRHDFDLVVDSRYWHGTFAALAGWYVHRSTYWLEKSSKALLFPAVGPALHLHASVSWFGVPVVATGRLLARATGNALGCLSPAPVDELRIWLAHAVFQNLALDMSELLAIRELMDPALIGAARAEAIAEGWPAGFELALAATHEAIDCLDGGVPVALPVLLPLPLSLTVGAQHSFHLLRTGHPRAGTQAAALRMALIAAKYRRRRLNQ
jgi:hypothetical protein